MTRDSVGHASGQTRKRLTPAVGRTRAQESDQRPAQLRDPRLVASRVSLCVALDALAEQNVAVTVIGSHAVHERTSTLDIESTTTKDADLAVTPELAAREPSISAKMREAGLLPLMEIAAGLPEGHPGKTRWSSRPGLWATGIDDQGNPVDEVDLLVPEVLAGRKGRSAKTLPDHGRNAIGRVPGIELAVLERDLMSIEDFTSGVSRPAYVARVSGLICAKSFKISDRLGDPRTARTANVPKDLVDLWRCLSVADPQEVREAFERHSGDQAAGEMISEGRRRFAQLLADPQTGSLLARPLATMRKSREEAEALLSIWQRTFPS